MSLNDLIMIDWRGQMTRFTTDELAAFIGLDWADTQHDICLQVAGSAKREFQVLEQRPEVIDAWATDLLQRFQGRLIAMALELNKGPIVEALRKYDGLVLFHINPMMLARYREAFTPSRAKDDPTDAELQLDLLEAIRKPCSNVVPVSSSFLAVMKCRVTILRKPVKHKMYITNVDHSGT
jgi:Transposase